MKLWQKKKKNLFNGSHLLRGANTRKYFWPCSPTSLTTPDLLSKITNLLLQRLKVRNSSCSPSATSQPHDQHESKLRNIENHQLISQTPNFLISLMITNIKPCATIIYISLMEVQLVARLQFLSHALKRKKMAGERNWLWL